VTSAVTGDGVYSFGLTNGSTDSAFYSSKEGVNPPELVITEGGPGPPLIGADGGTYVCSFEADVPSQPGTYPVSVSASLAGGIVSADDNTTVTVTNLPSSLSISVSPDPIIVPAPGDDVTVVVRVNNTSAGDSVTITSLVDNYLGNLAGKGNCKLPQTITAGQFYQCSHTISVSGSVGENKVYIVTALGTDDDSQSVSKSKQLAINLIEPPVYQILLPTLLNRLVVSEPNNSCEQAYRIGLNRDFQFLPDDARDWYWFDLSTPRNIEVWLTNFTPVTGQIVAYYSANKTCATRVFVKNNGDFSTTKPLILGSRPAGRYYILVINDGATSNTPYTLHIQAP
jgi:hypothetical protein